MRNGLNSTWRWLELQSTDVGVEQNMTLDEALLESFVAGEAPETVRVYRWDVDCVTLGKNQNIEQARGSYPGKAIYRRPTGGRAVTHGTDLTVTVIADENSLRCRSDKGGILASYHQILAGVTDTICSYGVDAVTGKERSVGSAVDCFSSVGKCDVIDARTGDKIVGCAQLRSRGAILQQMSLRPHQRYHIESREFLSVLKTHLKLRLAVKRWESSMVALPSEYLRSSVLFDSYKEGAEHGTKNSYV